MSRTRSSLALLALLATLTGCLNGNDAGPTATAVATATRDEPTAMVTEPGATSTALAATPAAPSAIRPTSTAVPVASQVPVLEFDATPTAAEALPTFEPQGVAYELVATLGQPLIPQAPMDVQMLADGRLVVADAGRREIQIYSPALDLMTSWPTMVQSPFNDEWAAVPAEQVAVSQTSFYAGIEIINGIARYSEDGELLAQQTFGDPALTLFDLVAGPNGRLYAAVGSFNTVSGPDQQPFGIYVFDADLELIEIWESGPDWIPLSLAFAPDGALHSLVIRGDAGTAGGNLSQPARFVVIDPAGYDPAVWETPIEFATEGNFDGLALTTDGAYLLIEEASHDPRDGDATTVLVMTPAGEELDRWEVVGHAAAQPRTATGLIAVGPPDAPGLPGVPDRVVLADPLGQRIWFLGLDGEVIREFAGDPANIAAPSSIVTLPNGDVAVLDIASREISIYDSGGTRPERYPIGVEVINPVWGVVGRMFGGGDALWYIGPNEASPFSLHRVDLTTGDVSRFETDPLIDASERAIFSPAAGAVGADGRLYIANGDGTVRSFSADGEYFERWPAEEASAVEDILDVAAGLDGIYILWEGDADAGRGVYVSHISETPEDARAFFAESDAPRTLDVGADGRIILLDPFTGIVTILDGSGAVISRWRAASREPLQMRDIAVDPEGRIYLTDMLQREVLVYAPPGI